MNKLLGKFLGKFGYDATESTGKRKPPRVRTMSEDAVLTASKRKKLVATSRDILRNYSIAGWMVRCHLDYVTRFTFQCRSNEKHPGLDKKIEAFIKKASRPYNFDVAGKFSLSKAVRFSEARKVFDGDIFWHKLKSAHIQLIEGDRIATPRDLPKQFDPEEFVLGVRTNKAGKILSICVCSRGKSGKSFDFERIIPAKYFWQHACFDSTFRVDQARGISPLAPALNTLQDTYEGIDLAMAKAKVAQMFGLVFSRQTMDGEFNQTDDTEEEEGSEETPTYDVKPNEGPFVLDLEDGDKAEFLSTATPETELLNALLFTTDLTLKALDIPYSFYDSSKANYYAQKADIQKYENSAKSKREDNQQLLDNWTHWRLRMAILAGELVLPAGVTVDDLQWEWVPAAMPWIDKLRDMKADELAIELGLDSTELAARRAGQDARDIAVQQADYEVFVRDMRESKGLSPSSQSTSPTKATGNTKQDDNA